MAYEDALAQGAIPRFEFTAAESTRADALLEIVGGYKVGGGVWVNDQTGETGELSPEEADRRLFEGEADAKG
jgi:hypothetical protein